MASTSATPFHVSSNVARDLLQSAAVFKSVPSATWEYVSNALQYVDPGIKPAVIVTINSKQKTLEIRDNGRGMDAAGVNNFFTMHGQNLDRLAGKAGRGMFGTGKSAAFGIADKLTLRTIRNGVRNTVTLSRNDIEREGRKGNVATIPVTTVEHDVKTSEANGTTILVQDIGVRIDVPSVIAFLQRHLAHARKDAEIIVNGHPIEYEEPSYRDVYAFTPSGELVQKLGNVTLTVKVATAPLDEAHRGVDITSQGVWFETTLGSVTGQPMSQYLFGELDVPKLIEETQGPCPAFNMTRDMSLNMENDLVQAIHAFIGAHLDEIRRRLVDEDKKRRASEEARKLQAQADSIAQLLNSDFNEYSGKLQRIRAAVSGTTRDAGPDTQLKPGGDIFTSMIGGDDPVEVQSEEGAIGGEGQQKGHGGNSEREQAPMVAPSENGDPLGKTAKAKPSERASRGGFQVKYDYLGADQYRAVYDRDTRTIWINLDFPQISEAKSREGTESPDFRRLSNEIAITEYAIAISQELVRVSEYNDPTDYIFEIRQTINRINRRAAEDALERAPR